MQWKSILENKLNTYQDLSRVYTTLARFKQVWNMICDLKIQPKTTTFMCRVARNILPTRSRLISKNIQVGNGCYLCGAASEKVWHLFHTCEYHRAVMRFYDVYVQQVDGSMDLTIWLEFLKKTLKDLDATDRDLMVALWEGIWKQRIQAWLSKPVENPTKLFLQTTTNLRSF